MAELRTDAQRDLAGASFRNAQHSPEQWPALPRGFLKGAADDRALVCRGGRERAAAEQRGPSPTTRHMRLESSFGLHVSAGLPTSQRGDGGWCDGVSFFDSGVVVYAQQHGRRDNFTLAHELGHFLVFDDTDALNWIADQPDPGRTLEQVCEEIAAQS